MSIEDEWRRITIDRRQQCCDSQRTVGPFFAGQVRLFDHLRFLELLSPEDASVSTPQVWLWLLLVRHTSCRRICG